MIVTRQEGSLRLVTQCDHAHFSARLLSMWRSPELADHPRRRRLLEAIREHDNGWREADAAPRVDPATGTPYGFLDLPDDERLEIWRRGTRRYVEEEPYVALLVVEHARALLSQRGDDEPYRQLLDELEELREELLPRAGVASEEVAADYRWLDLADALSLAACVPWSRPFERQTWSIAVEGVGVRIDPFPLAGATTFEVPCRWLPDRSYGGDADLVGALAAERWQKFPVRVAPLWRGDGSGVQ